MENSKKRTLADEDRVEGWRMAEKIHGKQTVDVMKEDMNVRRHS